MNRLVFTYIVILILSAQNYMKAENLSQKNSDFFIQKVDSMLLQKKIYNREKELKIAEVKEKAGHATTDIDRYLYNSLLYKEYSTFNADSALKYIDRNIDIANRVGNDEWRARTSIDKSELLAGTGLLNEATAAIRGLDSSKLPYELLVDYYGQMIFLYSHLGNYAGGDSNQYYVKERLYKDSIMEIINPSHHDYLWYKGWDILGTDNNDPSVIAALVKKLESSKLNSRQDAKDAYMLSKLYEQKRDYENFKKYMAVSAMVDIKTANAEIASLEELAKIMFKEGDIDRAYPYINYSFNQALRFPNRVRTFGIASTLDTINYAYQERNRQQEHRIRIFLVLVCILAVISIATVVIIILQNRQLKKQRANLDEANLSLNLHLEELSSAQKLLASVNTQLNEANKSLQSKNEELNEANYVKEEYIGYIFTICSNYIRKLDDLRKSIHVKAVTRKYKEIEESTASADMMKDELKDFYHSFDSIFLHIYPDFVSDFNSLLLPEKQIIPKEGELLNTELRIYALVRLGITDSVKIAEFLHCSPQTVYNNRFKVRNKSIIPKEKFAETVRTLGKFMERPS